MRVLFSVFGALTLFATAQACAGQLYTLTDLGTLGGTYSQAVAINDSGQITGNARTASNAELHGFVYSGGVMTDVGTFGGGYSYGTAISESGAVAGYAYTYRQASAHAFVDTD